VLVLKPNAVAKLDPVIIVLVRASIARNCWAQAMERYERAYPSLVGIAEICDPHLTAQYERQRAEFMANSRFFAPDRIETLTDEIKRHLSWLKDQRYVARVAVGTIPMTTEAVLNMRNWADGTFIERLFARLNHVMNNLPPL